MADDAIIENSDIGCASPDVNQAYTSLFLLFAQHRQAGCQRFKNEVAILAKLDHAGLTTVYHSGSTPEGFLWYTMAWLDGRNLAEELTSHPPGPARVMEILLSVLHSLRYIHSQGIIHRDLKPANIMLCNDGRVRLLDGSKSSEKVKVEIEKILISS